MATIAEIVNDLDDALDYEEVGSVSKARTVITLCKKLLVRRPDSSGHAGSSVSFDSNQLRLMMEDARVYVNSRASGNGNGVKFLGVDPRR